MALGHVTYELERVVFFVENGNYVPVSFQPQTPQPIRDAVEGWVQQCILESALVHLRNVAEFLVNQRPTRKATRTDIVADHYFQVGWEKRPNYVLGHNRREHDRLVKQIHRRVAHLSSQRLSVQRSGPFDWLPYVQTQFPPALAAFRCFLDDLEKTHPRRCHWFERADLILTSAGFPTSRPHA